MPSLLSQFLRRVQQTRTYSAFSAFSFNRLCTLIMLQRHCKCIKSCYCIMFLNVIINMQLRQYSVCFLFSIVPECWGDLPFSRWSWQENISNNFVLLHYPALGLVMAVHILEPSRTFVANCYWAHPTAEWSQKSPLQRQYWKRLPWVLAAFPQKCSFAKWQNSLQTYLPS